MFLGGTAFLAEFLGYPGGLVDYASAFVLQCCQYGWLGAAIATLIAWSLCRATKLVLSTVAHTSRVQAAHLVPALFLLAIHNRYDPAAVVVSLGLALATGAAAAYALALRRGAWLRAAVFCGSLVALWYVAGLGPALFFALLGGTSEVAGPTRWLSGTCCLIACGALYAVVFLIGGTKPADTFTDWGGRCCLVTTISLCVCILAMTAFSAALRRTEEAACDTPGEHGASWKTRCLALCRSAPLQWAILGCFLLAGTVFLQQSFDQRRKRALLIEHMAQRQDWEQVLATASSLPELSTASRLHVLRALYHTGRLADDMFSYPQVQARELLPEIDQGLDFCRALSVTLLELGQVNLAEHYAHESLEHEGDRPDTLLLLVRINILKGRTQAARTFLNLLAKNPFQRSRAKQLLDALDADPQMRGDAAIGPIRSIMPATDIVGCHVPTAALLQQLLGTNRRNRMAFEYLMAHFLLTQQLDQFAENMKRFEEYGYPALPRHYEEAIVMLARFRDPLVPESQARAIRKETLQRFAWFDEIAHRHARDLSSVQSLLAREFGNTYWFFSLYGYTPGAAPTPATGDGL